MVGAYGAAVLGQRQVRRSGRIAVVSRPGFGSWWWWPSPLSSGGRRRAGFPRCIPVGEQGVHAGQCLQRRLIESGGQPVGRPAAVPVTTVSAFHARGHRKGGVCGAGSCAASWLIEAAAGTRRIRPKMAEAVTVAKRQVPGEVDRLLGIAALVGRFTDTT